MVVSVFYVYELVRVSPCHHPELLQNQTRCEQPWDSCFQQFLAEYGKCFRDGAAAMHNLLTVIQIHQEFSAVVACTTRAGRSWAGQP